MFEKIKDFLYDISDIVLSLLIIGLIFFAVSWKISDTLSMDVDPPTESVIETTSGSQISVTPVETTEATIENTESSTEATTEVTTEPATEAVTEAPKLENFIVSEGELGYTIGKNLESQGFVADSDEFVKRLIEMGYDSKLRAGTFKISKTDSLDTIIKVLAGQGRN